MFETSNVRMMVHHSNSNSSIHSLNAITFPSVGYYRSRKDDYGADLSDYTDELLKMRATQSCTLRRRDNNFSSLSLFLLKDINKNNKNNSNNSFFDNSILSSPKVEVTSFVEVMNSGDSTKVIQLADSVVKLCESAPSCLSSIITSEEALESFADVLCSSSSQENVTKSLLILTASILPLLSGEMVEVFINCGLAYRLYDIFDMFDPESNISSTLMPSINLVIKLSKYSSYGRNSLLCGGIHELLIKIALAATDPNISVFCCGALESIFANPEKIESEMIESCITPNLIQLLSLQNEQAVSCAFSMMSAIASHMPSIVNVLCNANVHMSTLFALQNQNLHGPCIKLIIKLCAADIQYVKQMIQGNLITFLLNLMGFEFAADAILILAILYERLHEVVASLLPNDIISHMIDITNNSPFAIKKQGSYFLATIILFSENETISNLITEEIIDILVDMLTSGQNEIVLRCLLAFDKLIHVAIISNKTELFATFIYQTDIFDVLLDLGENRLLAVSDRAVSLTKKLNSVIKM